MIDTSLLRTIVDEACTHKELDMDMNEREPILEPMFISKGNTYSALRFYDYQCKARGCNERTHVRLFPNESPTPTLLCICGERAQGGEGMMVLVRGPYHPDDEAPADSVPAQP